MKTSHTPGLWVIQPFNNRPPTIYQDGKYDVCVISKIAEYYDGSRDTIEEMANAHLIAAAPDMLQQLNHCHNIFKSLMAPSDERLAALSALIAKAQGQP